MYCAISAAVFLIFVALVYWWPIFIAHKIKVLERRYREEREQLKPLYGVWMICHDGPMGIGGCESAGHQFAEIAKHQSFAVNTAVAVMDAMEVKK